MNKKTLIIAIICLIADQISKIIASNLLHLNKPFVIIKNFFNFTLCHNEGVAWSLLENHQGIIIVISLIALVVIYRFMYCFKTNTRNTIAFGLILGGLSGNLVDRITAGYVIDFIDFIIFKYDFPVFNIGDICIVIGVCLLIYAIIKGEDINDNKSPKKPSKN